MSHKLNYGCGKDIKEGWENLDVIAHKGADIVRDFKRGIPRNDNYYKEILAQYSLTQIVDAEDFTFVINEFYRVLKKGGVLTIVVPDANAPDSDSYNDPRDQRYFTRATFDYFNIDHPYRWSEFSYGYLPWHIIEIKSERTNRLKALMTPANK
ncbi:MAG: hypothetical protein WD512_06005 [Candidatus Paceibacterota bacterium]